MRDQPPSAGWPAAPPRADRPPTPEPAGPESPWGHLDPPGGDAWVAPGAEAGSSSTASATHAPNPAPVASPFARRRTFAALVVAVVVCLLAGVIGLVVVGDDGDDLATTPSTTAPPSGDTVPQPTTSVPPAGSSPSTAAPPTTSAPSGPTITEAELTALVDELSAFVEDAREVDFLRPVTVELLDGAAFETRLLEDFDQETIEDIERLEVVYRALGIIGPDESLVDLLRDFLGLGVLGFYDPESEELVVRGSEPGLYVQSTIVHELVHALDDQHFELHRPEYDDRPDEIGTGFSAVVEGNARRVESEWAATLTADQREELRTEQQAVGESIDFTAFPQLLVNQLLAPYQLGERLVDEILVRNGERGVDTALTTPPDTSEQVLFSDKYFAGEPRIDVPAPEVPGDQVDEGVVGALFWFLLLSSGDSAVNPADAERATAGWGGDWYVSYLLDEEPCFRADVAADTESDLDEFEDTIRDWALGAGTAVITRLDDLVQVDTCAAGTGTENPDI